MPGELLPGDAYLGADVPEGIACDDDVARGFVSSARSRARLGSNPLEATPVVGDDLVEGNGAGAVVPITALALCAEVVVAAGVEADVLGRTRKSAGISNAGITRLLGLLVLGLVVVLLLLGTVLLLLSSPFILLLAASFFFLTAPLFLFLALGFLFLLVALVLPVTYAVLDLVAGYRTGDSADDGAGLGVARLVADGVAAHAAGDGAADGAQDAALTSGTVLLSVVISLLLVVVRGFLVTVGLLLVLLALAGGGVVGSGFALVVVGHFCGSLGRVKVFGGVGCLGTRKMGDAMMNNDDRL